MDNFDDVYPIRDCEHEMNDELVTVLYKKKKLNIIEKLFFKKLSSKPYKIDLDDIGSFIWNLCDGKNNVEQIIEVASQHFKDKIEPANERVKLFIKQMNKNKLVKLYKKKD